MCSRITGSTGRAITSISAGLASSPIATTALHRLAVGTVQDRHLAGPRHHRHRARRNRDAEPAQQPGRHQHLVGARVVDRRLVQAARVLLVASTWPRARGRHIAACGLGQIVGHAERVGADVVVVLLQVALLACTASSSAVRTRSLNQIWMPRWKNTPANTPTTIVGVTATTLNSSTSRTCSRRRPARAAAPPPRASAARPGRPPAAAARSGC